MRKTKRMIEEVAQSYVAELQRRYPQTNAEIIHDAPDGFDVWVRVTMPPSSDEVYMEVLDQTVDLNLRFADETGVYVVATVADNEAVAGR